MEKYNLRPLEESERNLFFSMSPEEDEANGSIGLLSIRFARKGKTIWCNWCPIGPEKLVTPAFKEECNAILNELRQTVLSGMSGMKRFCTENGGQIEGDWTTTYGYIIDTSNYLCCLRCVPVRCDYNANLIFYDKQAQAQYLAEQNPNSKYGDVWVSICYDSGIERVNQTTGEEEICEGYYCQVYSDPYYEDEIDNFCIAVGYEIPDMSDESVKNGIRAYLGLSESSISKTQTETSQESIQLGGM